MMNLLQGIEQPAAATATGQLFVISCEPDPFTAERINIGVCAQDATGKRHVRCIDSPGRLTCLYDASADAVVRLAEMAAIAARENRPPPSTQIHYSEPYAYYGATQEALDAAFAYQVTVARPQRLRDQE